jgi:phosphate transport system permease protein
MIGETAALIYTAGIASSVNGWFSLDPLISGDTLTVHLYSLQSEPIGQNIQQQEAGTATLLILLLLLFNLGFRYLSTRLNVRFAGTARRR